MSELFYTVLIKILLIWLISLPVSSPATSNKIESTDLEKIYVKTSDLITREVHGKPSLIYHLITDYPHPHLPAGSYIKPGEIVASKPIIVRNNENLNHIVRKKNILYLVRSNETAQKVKN